MFNDLLLCKLTIFTSRLLSRQWNLLTRLFTKALAPERNSLSDVTQIIWYKSPSTGWITKLLGLLISEIQVILDNLKARVYGQIFQTLHWIYAPPSPWNLVISTLSWVMGWEGRELTEIETITALLNTAWFLLGSVWIWKHPQTWFLSLRHHLCVSNLFINLEGRD